MMPSSTVESGLWPAPISIVECTERMLELAACEYYGPMRFILAGVMLITTAFAQQPAANAVRMSKFILTVADLDKTYAFYHDALGIQLEGGATEISKLPPQMLALANQITGSPTGSSFRNANTRIPGTDFNFEFIELTGQPRTARRPRLQDPGASLLVLTVRDVDAALAAVKKAGGKVLTLGGAPLALSPESKSRVVIVTDPDGFYLELLQLDPAPATSAPKGSMVIGARWGRVVENAEKSASFYRDGFGMEAKRVGAFKDGNFLRVVGLNKGELRVHTPGVTATRTSGAGCGCGGGGLQIRWRRGGFEQRWHHPAPQCGGGVDARSKWYLSGSGGPAKAVVSDLCEISSVRSKCTHCTSQLQERHAPSLVQSFMIKDGWPKGVT
jgi:predicted enzyme related to lactoylglutathione lyase